MTRSPVTLTILTLSLLFSGSALAQGGFLDKLKQNIPQMPGSSGSAATSALSLDEITAGLKEALAVGAGRVVETVGKSDGYNSDPAIHIPLPESLQNVQSTLKKFGMSGMADDLELKLNRAAEAAAPGTKQALLDAIKGMSLDDAKAIYNGPKDAATQYFQRTTSENLKGVIKPVVDQSLSQVGAIASYDNLIGKYSNLPFVPNVSANLSEHTVGLALKGLFHYLAVEEAAIRDNPAKRTTELLSKVLGR
ncbi:MAG: DUF4197 domain-containing protein [Proteobacteria bacterium]|nr:DUF4197 domain-containing protein [Pseudomonadota bacterium]